MSNSRWRVVGFDNVSPFSSSGHATENEARREALRKTLLGYVVLAVMPHDDSVMVSGDDKARKLMQNMEKVLHQHPEWFFDDQAKDRYAEWKRLNGYASAGQTITIGPRKPKPQLPPEVWRVKPEVDKTDYMAAVRSMCGESSKGE